MSFTKLPAVYKHFYTAAFYLLPAFVSAQHRFATARENMIRQAQSNGVPSLSIAVVHKDSIIWEESFGYADREEKRIATIHTPYYIASITKLMTAASIMQLIAANKISMDAPVNNYLHTKLRSTSWNASDITVRRLLQHTAGLGSFNLVNYPDAEQLPGADTIISRYAIPVWQPGTRFDYSNIGYRVLSRLVEERSGKSLADYFQVNIFDPTGMRDSYIGTDKPHEQEAIRYKGDAARTRARFAVTLSTGAAGVFSSVHDLAMLSMYLLKIKTGWLPSQWIDTLKFAPLETAPAQKGIALGFQQNYFGYPGWLSQGGTTEAQAWLQLIPSEEMAVIVLSNTGNANCLSVIQDIFADCLPGFAENLHASKNSTPAQTAGIMKNAQTLPLGIYKGFLKTYNKDIPVLIELTDTVSMRISFDGEPAVSVTTWRWGNGRLNFSLPANLNIREAGMAPYQLKFELVFRANTFRGAAITAAVNDQSTPNLPFWVELSK